MSIKQRLIEYMQNDWNFPSDIDADTLAGEINEALVSTDGILRDRLALDGFSELIFSGKVSDEKCRAIFEELISEKYLLNGLGKDCDDSIFSRAFSGYNLDNLIEYSETENRNIFTTDDILRAFYAVLKCFNEERDLRSFIDGKGWAHSIAHNADILASFATNEKLGRETLISILSAIKARVCQGHSSIICEYSRLREPVLNVLERGIVTEQEFADWITEICNYEITGNTEDDSRLIMSRCEFMIFLNNKIKEKHPNLHPYVLSAIVELMKK